MRDAHFAGESGVAPSEMVFNIFAYSLYAFPLLQNFVHLIHHPHCQFVGLFLRTSFGVNTNDWLGI